MRQLSRGQLNRILVFLGGPREARGHASLRSAQTPRFARPQRLASLGRAELRMWLSYAAVSFYAWELASGENALFVMPESQHALKPLHV